MAALDDAGTTKKMEKTVAAVQVFYRLSIALIVFSLAMVARGIDDDNGGHDSRASDVLTELAASTAVDPLDRAILLELLSVFERNREQLWAFVGGRIAECEQQDGTKLNLLQWQGEILAYSRLSKACCACLIRVDNGSTHEDGSNDHLLAAVYNRTTNDGDLLKIACGNEATFLSNWDIEWKSAELEEVQLSFTVLSRTRSDHYVVSFQKKRGLFVVPRKESPLEIQEWARFLNVGKYFEGGVESRAGGGG